MQYRNYIIQKRKIYDKFYQFIENANSSEEELQNFITFLKTEKYEENLDDFKLVMHIISNISSNHNRYQTLIYKIERILLFYSEYIKQSFTKLELFNIFQNNKLMLLYLIEQKIIIVDEIITKMILKKDENKHLHIRYFYDQYNIREDNKSDNYYKMKRLAYKNYSFYFFPEIKQFLDEHQREEIEEKIKPYIENFEINRHNGENESYICELIRKDLVEEFIIYVNRTNLQITSQINESIFESNPLLMRKRPTLIEYAAFFGSIQIFQYLQLTGVNLEPSLWKYIIHGNNPEMIHLLERNGIIPEGDTCIECLQEAIKCHHNDIANYILDNLMQQNIKLCDDNFLKNKFSFGFHYHNYEFIQNCDNFQFIFYYACLYDYLSIIKLLLENKMIDLKQKVVQLIFFIYRMYIFILQINY